MAWEVRWMEYRKLTDYDRRATAMLAELSAD